MAQTYRKSKVEKLYSNIESRLTLARQMFEKAKHDKTVKDMLEGEIYAFETILEQIQKEFDLTAE